MDGSQQKLAHALLSSGLSRHGYAKAVTVMSLERSWRSSKARLAASRAIQTSTTSPSSAPLPIAPRGAGESRGTTFGQRLVVDGQRVAPTPNFLGSNPARVPDGTAFPGLAGLRVLAAEEDLARRILAALEGAGHQRP
jgi:hypothetical protein